MDFVADGLGDGRKFRSLYIADDYSREFVAAEVDTSIPGARVVRVLEQLRDRRGLPQVPRPLQVESWSSRCLSLSSSARPTTFFSPH